MEQDYSEFFDNERIDAIEKMRNVYGSEEVNDIGISYLRLACMIFEVRNVELMLMLFSIFSG